MLLEVLQVSNSMVYAHTLDMGFLDFDSLHDHWIWQDIRLALAMAEDAALPTPVAASVNELYKRAKAAGLGDQDFSAILEAFELDPKQSNHWQQFCPWIRLFASSQLCTQMLLGGNMDIYIDLILKTLISGMHQTARIFLNTGGRKDYKKSYSQEQQVHNPELY
jgi:hypothetical protein